MNETAVVAIFDDEHEMSARELELILSNDWPCKVRRQSDRFGDTDIYQSNFSGIMNWFEQPPAYIGKHRKP